MVEPREVEIVHEKDSRSCARDCGDGVLDCFSCFGRGVTSTAAGTYRVAQVTAYPVKETFVQAVESVECRCEPYRVRAPLQAGVPSFTYR